jgi:hypothetical protein
MNSKKGRAGDQCRDRRLRPRSHSNPRRARRAKYSHQSNGGVRNCLPNDFWRRHAGPLQAVGASTGEVTSALGTAAQSASVFASVMHWRVAASAVSSGLLSSPRSRWRRSSRVQGRHHRGRAACGHHNNGFLTSGNRSHGFRKSETGTGSGRERVLRKSETGPLGYNRARCIVGNRVHCANNGANLLWFRKT